MTTEELQDTEAQIASDRLKYHISPVELHKVPGWFYRRLKIILDPPAVYHLDQVFPGATNRIFDHFGTTPDGSFVGEPYAKVDDPGLADKAGAIAKALGIRVVITGPLTSWWYPRETIRVSFFEGPDSKTLDQLRADVKKSKKLNLMSGQKYKYLTGI